MTSITIDKTIATTLTLWFIINTDLTITTEKLVELFATMDDKYVELDDDLVFHDIDSKLDEQLDLPHPKVAEMKRNLHSPSQRREVYLDLYATSHPCPSWRQVAMALRLFGLPHQADTVESTYVQGTRIIPKHPLSVTVIVRFVMAKHIIQGPSQLHC